VEGWTSDRAYCPTQGGPGNASCVCRADPASPKFCRFVVEASKHGPPSGILWRGTGTAARRLGGSLPWHK
jgi:hypothetical protein